MAVHGRAVICSGRELQPPARISSIGRGSAAGLLGQLLLALQHAVGRIAQRAADADGAVVAQIPAQLARDHRHAVGREADVFRRVEVGDGLQKPDAPT